MGMELNEDDVLTLLGYATILRHDGKVDMPAYFYRLAERIAKTMNDEPMAQRVRDIAAQEVAASFLNRAGIITADGCLAPQYKDDAP